VTDHYTASYNRNLYIAMYACAEMFCVLTNVGNKFVFRQLLLRGYLLVQEVEECDATLSYFNYYSDLNNFDIIVQIIGRLPTDLQHRWLRDVASMEETNREANFKDVVLFLKRKHRF